MTKDHFIEKIASLKAENAVIYGIKTKTEAFTENIFYTLFDKKAKIDERFDSLEKAFKEITIGICDNPEEQCNEVWDKFVCATRVLTKLQKDAQFILDNDPASKSLQEIYLAYPGFYAIAIYRLSHELYKLGMHLFSRIMSEYAHRITGTDIHAGAAIDCPFFIDHATGIVIGETCVIESHVKVYQGVTLGALSVSKDLKNRKRHPTVSKKCLYLCQCHYFRRRHSNW